MSTSGAKHQEEVRLYADACSGRFVLKHSCPQWVKEFPTLPEAIRFVANLPREGILQVILLDEAGHPLTKFFLRPC